MRLTFSPAPPKNADDAGRHGTTQGAREDQIGLNRLFADIPRVQIWFTNSTLGSPTLQRRDAGSIAGSKTDFS